MTRDDSGIELVKGQVMMFATALDSAPAYGESVAAAGFGDVAEEIRAHVAAGDLRAAVQAVPDAMADALTLSGSAEHVRARIDAYRSAGLTRRDAEPLSARRLVPPLRGSLPGRRRAAAASTFLGFLGVVDTTLELLGT